MKPLPEIQITCSLRNREGEVQRTPTFLGFCFIIFVLVFSVFAIRSGLSREDRRESNINKQNKVTSAYQESAPEVVYR